MAVLKTDDQGFLVGNAIDLGNLADEWRRVSADTKAIRSLVSRIASALLNKSQEVPVSSQLRTSSTDVAASPRTLRKKKHEEVKHVIEIAEPKTRSEPSPKAQKLGRKDVPSVPGFQGKEAQNVAKNARSSVAEPAAREARESSESPKNPQTVKTTETPRLFQKKSDSDNSPRVSVQAKVPVEPRTDQKERKTKKIDPENTSKRQEAKRDSKGRFLRTEGRTDEANGPERSFLSNAVNKLSDSLKNQAVQNAGDIDPAVEAAKEVAAPIVGGLELLGIGGEGKEEGWLRRIFRTIRDFRKEESVFNKSQEKLLKEISERPDSNQSASENTGGLAGALGGFGAKAGGLLLAFMKKVPLLSAAFGGLTAAIDVFRSEDDLTKTRAEKDRATGAAIGSGVGSVAGGIAGGALTGAKLGALFGPVGAAVGTAVGGAAGAFFAGKAGDFVGEKIGSFVAYLREADVPGQISGVWVSFTETLKTGWSDAIGKMRGVWEETKKTASDVFESTKKSADKAVDAANEWVKDKTGVDISITVKNAFSGGDSSTNKARESAARSNLDRVLSETSEENPWADEFGKEEKPAEAPIVRRGVQTNDEQDAVNRANAPKEVIPELYRSYDAKHSGNSWELGQTSEIFESGGRGAGTISHGRGDFGGESYGTYQLSSRQGSLQRFIKQSGYENYFQGFEPGSIEFDKLWTLRASTDPEFAQKQRDFVKAEYYDKAQKRLQDKGIDLSGRGRAVQDAIWSTSVQFGAGGAANMLQRALADKDVASMDDAAIVSALQDFKIANNESLFRSSSSEVRKGTLNRARNEKKRLLALAREDSTVAQAALKNANVVGVQRTSSMTPSGSVAAPAAVVTARPVKVPKARPQAAQAPMARVEQPISSNGSGRPVVVAVNGEVGQDVKDRSIAHIVTGGVS